MKNDLRKYQREEILADIEANRLRLLFYDMQIEEADAAEAKYKEQGLAQNEGKIEPAVIALIDKGLRKRDMRHFVRHIMPPLSKAVTIAASILLVFFISLSAAFAISSNVRYRVMELLIHSTNEYIVFGLGETTSIEIPAEWRGSHYPSYIPDNYEIAEFYGNADAPGIIFSAPDGNELDFAELDELSSLLIDSENAVVTNTTVHDLPATVVEKGRSVSVVWAENNRYFCLIATTDADTALQVARSVVKIK